MNVPQGKYIYFASDFHLGLPDYKASIERERFICRWLDEIKETAHTIFLVGDLFDVWFEYKNVIPKGYTRFLGKLAELSDRGITIEVFTGNHDLWMRDYFRQELDIQVHTGPLTATFNGKKFYIAHGDGLGPGDQGYKFLKKVMSNRFSQWLYRRIHPDTGIKIADYFSKKGPKHLSGDNIFLGEDKEWLVLHARAILQHEHFDYFIFGHRHLAMTLDLGDNATYINLGDWLSYNTYAVLDGEKTVLRSYPDHLPYRQPF